MRKEGERKERRKERRKEGGREEGKEEGRREGRTDGVNLTREDNTKVTKFQCVEFSGRNGL